MGAHAQRTFTQEPQTWQNGPSWYDVNETQAHLERKWGAEVLFHVKQCRSVDGKKGQYIRANLNGYLVEGLGAGFGQSHPNGPKTFPAALYNLLLEVDALWDSLTPLERNARFAVTEESARPF